MDGWMDEEEDKKKKKKREKDFATLFLPWI